MIKKIKSKKGFTLIEMLACTVTLVLITLICTTGMNMATKSYNESMFESNSQKLEYILNLSMGDILRYSHDIDITTEVGKIFFTNEVYGVSAGELKLDESGYFVLVKNRLVTPAKEAWVVSTMNYVDGLYVEGFTLSYNTATNVYTGSYKIKSNLTSQERLVEFTYKSIVESI